MVVKSGEPGLPERPGWGDCLGLGWARGMWPLGLGLPQRAGRGSHGGGTKSEALHSPGVSVSSLFLVVR